MNDKYMRGLKAPEYEKKDKKMVERVEIKKTNALSLKLVPKRKVDFHPAEKTDAHEVDGARNIGQSGLTLRKVSLESKALIFIEAQAKTDPAAEELLNALKNADDKTASYLLNFGGPILLADYKRGLELFDPKRNDNPERRDLMGLAVDKKRGRFLEIEVKGKFEDIKIEELKCRMGWLFDTKAHPLENLIRYVTTVDALGELSRVLVMQKSLAVLETKTGSLIDIPSMFSRMRLFYPGDHAIDIESIGAIGKGIVELAVANTKMMAPKLVDAIEQSNKDSGLEMEKCAIAAKALIAAGEPGFHALLKLYTETKITHPIIKNIAHTAAKKLGTNMGSGEIVVMGMIKRALINFILGHKSAPLAVSFLREAALADRISGPSADYMNLYRSISASKDGEMKLIMKQTERNQEEIEAQLARRNRSMPADAIYLAAMVKAIITDHAYWLISEQKSKEAYDALKKAELFAVKAATIEIRYAMALALYASGNKREAAEQLKLALSADDDSLTGLTKILNRVPPAIAGHTWMDLAGNFEGVEEAKEKILEHYVLGIVIYRDNNKNSNDNERFSRELGIMFLRMLKASPIWESLEESFKRNDLITFQSTIKSAIKSVKDHIEKNLGDESAHVTSPASLMKEAFNKI